MKVLVCSSTFEKVTHGPAKFAQLLLFMEDLYPDIEIRLLSRGITNEVAEKKYKIVGWYPRGIGIFWEYFDNGKYLRRIKKIKEIWRPDIILFVDVILGYLTAKYLGNDIVTIGLINDDEYLRNSIRRISFSKEWFIKWKSRLLEQLAIKSVTKVITNSNYLSQEVCKLYEVDPQKVTRVYKSIQIEKFPFVERKKIDLSTEIRILFVKSDYIRGGLIELIVSLGRLKEFNFRLYICGPDKVEKLKIEKVITVPTNVCLSFEYRASQKRVNELLYECDIFCTPALREALGVANIEALSSGIPVVSSDAGGITEVLNLGENGWISRAGDVSNLVNTLEACLKSEKERRKKSRTGRKFVEENFGHTKMYKSLFEIFNQVAISEN